MKPSPGTRRWWLMGGALALGLTAVVAWVEFCPATLPPVAITFDGLASTNGALYEDGLFTVTNRSPRAVDWWATVEAPAAPGLAMHQNLSSYGSGGTLLPHMKTQLHMFVPGEEGVTFRLVVNLREPRSFPVRVWLGASEALPFLKGLWNPAKEWVRPVFGEWIPAPGNRGKGPLR